jgi:hypothetical protein
MYAITFRPRQAQQKIFISLISFLFTTIYTGYTEEELQTLTAIVKRTKKQFNMARKITEYTYFDSPRDLDTPVETFYFYIGDLTETAKFLKIETLHNQHVAKLKMLGVLFYGLNIIKTAETSLSDKKYDAKDNSELLKAIQSLLYFCQDLGCIIPKEEYKTLKEEKLDFEKIYGNLKENKLRLCTLGKYICKGHTLLKSDKEAMLCNTTLHKILFNSSFITSENEKPTELRYLHKDLFDAIQENPTREDFMELVEDAYPSK